MIRDSKLLTQLELKYFDFETIWEIVPGYLPFFGLLVIFVSS